MNAPAALGLRERIRARDGDRCWLCEGILSFEAEPNSTRAATIEHLVARANGGGNEFDNLVLTHPGCNRQLGARPVEQKRAMRAKQAANRAKVTAKRTGESTGALTAVAKAAATPVAARVPVTSNQASSRATPERADRDELIYWRRLALVGGGAGLVSVGLVLGLLAGALMH